MQGRIIKGIAGFYYVYDVVESVIYECKAKGIFRKEKIKPLVGDLVEYEILDAEEKTGNIIRILPRKNELIRPAVANIDQALVVFAVKKPDPHFNLLDRFLVMMERQEIPVIICFNKKDIADEPEIESLEKTYEACGYRVIFASAREGENILEIKEALKGKTTTVAGPSGVGKSSLINCLQENVNMETGSISRKIERGKHTTRHSELIPIDEDSYIMDTPGFSSLYTNDFGKEELKYYFPEFDQYQGGCRFQGCNHISEPGRLWKREKCIRCGMKIIARCIGNWNRRKKGGTKMEYKLSPSILSADFCNLEEGIRQTEENGAVYLHFDVMDGVFVPSISFGMPVLASIKPAVKQVIDTHLMITEPIRYVEAFAEAGADILTVHYEACKDIRATLDKIKACGMKTGLAISPDTPVEVLKEFLGEVDMFLVMTVHPGFGGQKLISEMLDKVRTLRAMLNERGLETDVQVDGGIYAFNVKEALDAGANVIVAGSAVFKGNAGENTRELMEILKNYE